MKKVLTVALLMGGFLFLSSGIALAGNETKPWESMFKFRGEEKLTAQEMDISREDFHNYRNEAREQHREERILQREERLQAAVERGCITEEEMTEKMQTRKGRFLK